MEIRKEFKFEAAHRLVSSYSKACQNIHGHSYVVELYLKSEGLNGDGMVMDFGEVKPLFGYIINQWDHSLIMWDEDPVFKDIEPILEKWDLSFNLIPFNPTAENMAQYLLNHAISLDLPASRVRVHETRTGWAECTL